MVDFNDLAAYQTPRVAKIKDWRLGTLWYGGVFCVVLYVALYAYILEKEYLRLQAPVGYVRSTAQSPRDANPSYVYPPPEDVPYCLVDPNVTTYNGLPIYPCLYFDQDLTVFPVGENNGISLTTRLTNGSVEVGTCSAYQPDCPWRPSETATDNFIFGVENFTIMLDHSFSAPDVGVDYRSATPLKGRVFDAKKNRVKNIPAGNTVGQANKTDIFTVQFLLDLAGISLDDESTITRGRSFRDDGIVILVFITYSNTFTHNTNKFRYDIRVIPQLTKFKVEQPIYTKNQASILEWNRHGIKFVFIQTGLLGTFDFSVLLLTFVSGIGMVAVVSVMVDMLAVYLVPQSSLYYKYKYLETPEFKQLQKKDGHYDEIGAGTDNEADSYGGLK